MRLSLKIISFAGLLLTILPAFLHFYGVIEFEQHKPITFMGTTLYLLSAPFWMNKTKKKTTHEA
jgi:hypothetical protein